MEDLPFKKESLEKALGLIKALDNEKRLMILCMLCSKEMTVSEMAEASGLSLSPMSQHLAVLKNLDLVEYEKNGLNVIYRLKGDNIRDIIKTLKNICCK
ncbi:MAG: ArsR/SmtB family transcription factor [Alphaproteobacteria bacterium]